MACVAVMNVDKLKKAVNALPDDPAAGIEFRAFWGAKDKDKTEYFGLYVGSTQEKEFNKDKGDYKGLTLYKGMFHRSAKSPSNKLVLESLGKPNNLKLLGKEALKACALKYAIVAIQQGEPEPELTPEELAELGLTPGTPAAPAPASSSGPPARPNAGPPPEYKRFLARVDGLRTALKCVPEIAGEVKKAIGCAKTDPAAAHVLLDEVDQVVQNARRQGQNPLLRASDALATLWTDMLANNPGDQAHLSAGREAVLKAIDAGNAKEALTVLVKLQDQAKHLRQLRQDSQRAHARQLVFKSDKFSKNFDTAYFADLVAGDLGLSPDEALALVQGMVGELKASAKDLLPPGTSFGYPWSPDKSWINPLLPDEARPKLTPKEAQALNLYSKADEVVDGETATAPYKLMNARLWQGLKPEPPHDKDYEELQKAFKKAKPLAKPVRVTRGLQFGDDQALADFVRPFNAAAGSGVVIPLNGFLSTGTAGTPKNFTGNVEFVIIARLGLDLQPYTNSPHERELLLNHGTLVKVHSVRRNGKCWEITVEQVLPKSAR